MPDVNLAGSVSPIQQAKRCLAVALRCIQDVLSWGSYERLHRQHVQGRLNFARFIADLDADDGIWHSLGLRPRKDPAQAEIGSSTEFQAQRPLSEAQAPGVSWPQLSLRQVFQAPTAGKCSKRSSLTAYADRVLKLPPLRVVEVAVLPSRHLEWMLSRVFLIETIDIIDVNRCHHG